MSHHPLQEIVLSDGGVIRFRRNAIVRFLLDAGPYDLNKLSLMPWSKEDWCQLAQLIGYSVSGYGDLPYVDEAEIHRVDQAQIEFESRSRPEGTE